MGRYRLHERLGDGGMGTVYRATVDAGDVAVAVKVIHPHLRRESGFEGRFAREAELGRRVDHVNVVRTLGAEILREGGEETALLVMEYVEGRTLRSLLTELGRVPESLLRELARQIAAGLRSIHEAGIVHRDLKPENVLITHDDQVRIMDLGVARPVQAATRLTQEGHFAGSLLYAAPEQLRGEAPSTACDQYGLGLLLYELAAGHHPFEGEDTAEIVGAHLHASPRRLIDAQPDVSPFFSEVVATLMDKSPERRFPTTEELLRTLEHGEAGGWWSERTRLGDRALRPLRIPVTRETEVFGRSRELGLLRGAWDAARRGEGRTILVEGEAGVGKTRLVDAFVEEVGRQVVHTLYGSYPPEGTQNGLTKAVVEHFGRGNLEERLAPHFEDADALAETFLAALRHEVPVDGASAIRGVSFSAALVRLARGLASERPVLWVVEDLHNASPTARGRVLALARAVEELPLLLVLTTRPGAFEQELPELARLEGFHRLLVPRLDEEALQKLTDALFLDPGVAERVGPLVASRTDGVPFFLFELLHGLCESGRLRRHDDGRYEEIAPVEAIEAPSSVRDLVRLRLSDLSSDQRHLIDVAAVQGHAFDPELQALVLQAPRVRVLQTLAHLERRGGLVRSKGAVYEFDHHLVQEIVRAELPLSLRQEYHALLAKALAGREGVDLSTGEGATDAVAHELVVHLLDSADPHGAMPFLGAAVQHLSLHAGEESVRALLKRALDELDGMSLDDRVDLLLQYAGSLHAARRRDPEREAIDEAAALAERLDDDGCRARVEMARGLMLHHVSKHDGAVQSLESAIRRAEAGGFEGLAALARQHLGFVYAQTGRHEEALAQCEAGLTAATRADDRHHESALLGQQAAALWALERGEEAEATAARAMALAREIGDWAVATRVLARIGSLCSRAGRPEQAADAFRQFLQIAEECGHQAWISFGCGNLGRTYEGMGRFDEALKRYEQAIRASRDVGDRRTESMYRGLVGGVRHAMGDFDGARASVEHSLRTLRDIGDRRLEACGLNVLGAIASARGMYPEAISFLNTALGLFERHPYPTGRASALRWLGMIHVRLGEQEKGRHTLEEARALAREIRAPEESIPASAALAALGAADAAEVLASLRAHETVLGARNRMRVLYDLHRATGDAALLVEARALLDALVANAPADQRQAMRETVPLHREVMAAGRA